ncbi:hybrid sensor histidine kinase/response regulator transcription factor [Persicobacter psychrovividus]|uniref:histidine kinase n=1 Tax=Persicobacter psychrovividus TaxID=387638 RepID=A0ABM7VM06_9BACT|nr:hybrid sensor histidine kinase/response regulator [Persicobacter psychrovividus]
MRFVIFCIIFVIHQPLFAACGDKVFKHLTTQNGLVSNHVKSIYQDSNGFMWFGTRDGLNRYDGYTFKTFQYAPNDTASLSNNVISCLIEDKHKFLWIGTSHGLNTLNLINGQIKRLDLFEDKREKAMITCLTIDSEKSIWVGTDHRGLIKLNAEGKVKQVFSSESPIAALLSNSIVCLTLHPLWGVMVGTKNGLYVIKQNEIVAQYLQGYEISNLEMKPDGSVMIGVSENLSNYYQLFNDQSLRKHPFPSKQKGRLSFLKYDREGNSWFAIQDKGLIFINQSGEVNRLQLSKFERDGINSNAIISFFEDDFGNLWFGTQDSGLNLLDKNRKPFISVRDNFTSLGLCNNRVRSLFTDSQGDVWVGTKVDGSLSRFNINTLEFTHFKHDPEEEESISNDFILCITEESPDYLWVGTLDGLNLFNKKTGTSKIFRPEEGNSNSLSSASIYALLKDKNDLYIGSVGNGLDIYNTVSGDFRHYSKNSSENSISDNRVKVIKKDHLGNIWVGTINGLNVFDPKKETFTRYLNDIDIKGSISNNYIHCIYEDRKNNLWVGTAYGLNLFDRKTKTFRSFTEQDGLESNSINGIIEDHKGMLWLSTNNGISCLNPESGKIKNYGTPDGLTANEYFPEALCQSQGYLIFGGNNGISMFKPVNIHDNQQVPRIVITNLKVRDKSLGKYKQSKSFQQGRAQDQTIKLEYYQSDFRFEFVAIANTAHEKCEYAYKLEGFDQQWNFDGNKREAIYTNVPAGKYTFKVKAANNDGVWSDESRSVILHIAPAPWLSNTAYIIYLILILLLIISALKLWKKRAAAEREHLLQQMKIDFFANVSHEFRTPLSLIISPLEKMMVEQKDKENKLQFELIHSNANRLLHLVNRLLDFQKIGSQQLRLEPSCGELISFLKKIILSFEQLAATEGIMLQFVTDVEQLNIYLDYEKFEIIVYNLLSNAFKFTPKGGLINIHLRAANSDEFSLAVEDTGVGIPLTEQNKIFDRFFQAANLKNNQMAGSGIGLSLTKEYVQLHRGNISVESIEGKGSSFVVAIPLIKASEQEMLKGDDQNKIDHPNNRPAHRGAKTILLVEDNEDFRLFLKSSLQQQFNIIEADNGLVALNKIEMKMPDLIISDVMMPLMDGHQMCEQLKKDPITAPIPIILLTAQNTAEGQVKGFASGADQYLSKPFKFDVLHSMICGLFESRQSLQQAFSKKIGVELSDIEITTNDEKLIHKVLKYIEDHMDQPELTVETLSADLDISRGHLYRKIRALTNRSPSDFIRRVRLKRAAQLLETTQLTISEIAYMVGFSNPKYFSKCFKTEFNQLPSQYAAENRIQATEII